MARVGCEAQLHPYLQEREKLLWAGRPGTGFRLRAWDTTMIPFSLVWGGGVIFWEVTALRGGNIFKALWGVPFVAFGLYFVAGRFWWDARVRAGQCYGVTSDRLLIKSDFPRTSIRSFDLIRLPSLTLVERSDATGSIDFSKPSSEDLPDSNFEFIDNARIVYDIILEAQKVKLR